MKAVITRLPTTAWSVIIVIASLNSSENLNEIKFDIPGLDKMVHFIMYGVLSFLLLWTVDKVSKTRLKLQNLIVVILVSSGFGILMEILQKTLTTVRNFDIYDIIANIIGILLGCGVYVIRFKPFK